MHVARICFINLASTFCPRPLPSQLDSYRESHTVHDDDVEQLKENIATKGKHIDDLQGKLDALKKVTHIVNSKSEKHQRR